MALSMEADISQFTILTPEATGVAKSNIYVKIKVRLDCYTVPTCATWSSDAIDNASPLD